MRILFILPNWLGDAVMATPAIEAISEHFSDARLTFVGSFVSIEALKHHPKCEAAFVDKTKKGGSRLVNTYRFAKKLGRFDLAVSFRNQIHSSLLLFWSGSAQTIARESWHAKLLLSDAVDIPTNQHLVLQYLMLSHCAGVDTTSPKALQLHITRANSNRATLGINPGATYGSAKRWYPEKFAEVAAHFADSFEIIIFGGPNETEMAEAIEKDLKALHVNNVTNLAGKTSIIELCAYIGSLDLFITNDSGPMHVAAAYQIPTVAIFGPTRHKETSQWKNPRGMIVRHEIECAPCMKRECPLKHHECMKNVTAQEVIEAAKKIIN